MSDVTIIGAGIIGLLTAREFALTGASVRILERGSLGRESSWAGGGILSPVYPWRQPAAITALSLHSQAVYPSLAEELAVKSGIDPQWIKNGLLISNICDPKEKNAWSQSHGIEQVAIGSVPGSAIGTDLRLEYRDAAFFPNIAQIRNPRLIKALAMDLQKRGVSIIENCEVVKFVSKDQRLSYLLTKNGDFSSALYVVSTGAWSKVLCHEILPDLDVEPVKGQIILFRGQPGILKAIVLDGNHYLIPRNDGRILAGSTLERVGFDQRTTDPARRTLENFARSRIPALENFSIEKHWAGLRPATPSGIPVISRHPQLENLYINTGHFRNGIVMGPASARLLVDIAMGREPIVSAQPYAIN